MACLDSIRECKKCTLAQPLRDFTFAHGVFTYECKNCTRLRQRAWANDKRRAMAGVKHPDPNGALMRQKDSVLSRLLSNRNITESGCWEWMGARRKNGYGKIELVLDGISAQLATHRVSAAIFHGLPLAERKALSMHKCDNPPCFNPDHLMIGNNSLNMRDAQAKGRVRNFKGESAPNAVFTDAQVREIKARVAGGETVISIARELGHMAALYSISQGRTWRHLNSSE
jgi:hypothetical protein